MAEVGAIPKTKRLRICFHCRQESHKVWFCRTDPKKLCGIDGCIRYHHTTDGAAFFEDRDSTSSESPDLNLADFESFHVANPGSISLQNIGLPHLKQGRKLSNHHFTWFGSELHSDWQESGKWPQAACQIRSDDTESQLCGSKSRNEINLGWVSGSHNWWLQQPNLLWLDCQRPGQKCGHSWLVGTKEGIPHLRKVPFPKLPNLVRISVLIGTDYKKLFKPVKVVDNPESKNDPWAVQTPLGWTCIGASAKRGSKSWERMAENMVVFQNDSLRQRAKLTDKKQAWKWAHEFWEVWQFPLRHRIRKVWKIGPKCFRHGYPWN